LTNRDKQPRNAEVCGIKRKYEEEISVEFGEKGRNQTQIRFGWRHACRAVPSAKTVAAFWRNAAIFTGFLPKAATQFAGSFILLGLLTGHLVRHNLFLH